MLPPDFVSRYAQLFYLALKEDVGGNSGVVKPGTPRQVKNVPLRDSGKGGRRVLKSGETKFKDTRKIGIYQRGGKRFRQFWTIRNEDAFLRKQSVDRKLLRLAKSIQGDLDTLEGLTTARRSQNDSGDSGQSATASLCEVCSAPLGKLRQELGAMLRYCPGCGTVQGPNPPLGS